MSCMIFWPSPMLILPQHPWWYPWTQKLFIPYRARKSIVPAETKRNLLVWTLSNPLLMFNANWLKNGPANIIEYVGKRLLVFQYIFSSNFTGLRHNAQTHWLKTQAKGLSMVQHQWKQPSVAKGERNRDCESTHSTYARGQWLRYAIAMTATTSTNAARGERSEDDQKMNTRKFTRKGSDSRPEASGGTLALETKAWNPRPEANGTKRPLERQAWNPRPEASRTQSVPKAGSRNT